MAPLISLAKFANGMTVIALEKRKFLTHGQWLTISAMNASRDHSGSLLAATILLGKCSNRRMMRFITA